MSMEAQEEAMTATTNASSSANNHYSYAVVRGKRTKRQRLLLQGPAPVAVRTSSASSSGELSGSTTTTTTEEDEDMANCLILLAQGRSFDAGKKPEPRLEEEGGGGSDGGGRLSGRRLAEAATAPNGKVGIYAYECKTCSKCFPSFQALGGHRTSHKKPKTASSPPAPAEEKKATEGDALQIAVASCPKIATASGGVTTTPTAINNTTSNAVTASNTKPRVHECSVCGSEFSSGQALGGHMRRHRPAVATPEAQEAPRKEKSILSLDLNLPAPADDDRGDFPMSPSYAAFAGKQPLVFSMSALVDCHY